MSLMLVFSMSVVAFEGVTPFNPWTAPSDQHYSSYHQLISQVSPSNPWFAKITQQQVMVTTGCY